VKLHIKLMYLLLIGLAISGQNTWALGGDTRSIESGLQGRSDLVFFGGFEEDFNNDEWESKWGIPWASRSHEFKIVPTGFTGSKALRLSYPAGKYGGGTGGQFPIAFREMAAYRSEPEMHHLESAYMRYCVKFEDGFDFKQGGKLPGFMGGGEAWRRSGGNQPNGSNGWTLRFMWREDGELFIYAYVPRSDNGKWGKNGWGQYIPTNIKLNTGQWHCIEQFVDVGTPGNDNGQLRVWVDEVERLTIDDMRFWDVRNDA